MFYSFFSFLSSPCTERFRINKLIRPATCHHQRTHAHPRWPFRASTYSRKCGNEMEKYIYIYLSICISIYHIYVYSKQYIYWIVQDKQLNIYSNESINFALKSASSSQIESAFRLDSSGAQVMTEHLQIRNSRGQVLFRSRDNVTEIRTDTILLRSKDLKWTF